MRRGLINKIFKRIFEILINIFSYLTVAEWLVLVAIALILSMNLGKPAHAEDFSRYNVVYPYTEKLVSGTYTIGSTRNGYSDGMILVTTINQAGVRKQYIKTFNPYDESVINYVAGRVWNKIMIEELR